MRLRLYFHRAEWSLRELFLLLAALPNERERAGVIRHVLTFGHKSSLPPDPVHQDQEVTAISVRVLAIEAARIAASIFSKHSLKPSGRYQRECPSLPRIGLAVAQKEGRVCRFAIAAAQKRPYEAQAQAWQALRAVELSVCRK